MSERLVTREIGAGFLIEMVKADYNVSRGPKKGVSSC
jgi:hypothetical protein